MADETTNKVREPKKVMSSIEEKLQYTELEFKKLQLEDLRTRVEGEKQRRAEIVRVHMAQQRSIDDANRQIMAEQEFCKHRKGGKNLQGILNGNDSDYSVISHRYPWGQGVVICTRCGKTVTEPNDRKSKTFKTDMALYREWASFPTDNEPSGTTLFKFERIA
jgi:hypothetical protein